VARLELLADRAERNEPREPMPSVDEEADLGVTQVYRPGQPLPVQTYSKQGKTIPMMSAQVFRPPPPVSDSAPQSGQVPPARASWPSSGAPPSQPSPQSGQQPQSLKLQSLSGMGPSGTAMMPHMTEAALAQFRAQQQAQQAQQPPGFRATGQNPMVNPPFAPTDATPPKQLRPWVAVVMGVGIGLLALLAIIIAISTRQIQDLPPPSPLAADCASPFAIVLNG
jgi:hypothetical protein